MLPPEGLANMHLRCNMTNEIERNPELEASLADSTQATGEYGEEQILLFFCKKI